MRKFVVLIIVFLQLSCSQKLYVSSDYDKAADFSTYKTFAWAREQEPVGKSHPMYDNELNRKRIRDAIEAEMASIGFKRFDLAPDILVDFHITIDQKMDYMVHDYYPFGFNYWPDYDMASYSYKKGALVIHFVDTKKEQLVWQGVGTKTLSDVPPENPEERIKKAVEKILSKYLTVK
ncbi:DUF4136 domain-containing protein [Roseivirga sp. 4D4]|uniref:DUF4136 domain-containing protein n=1 Tax=Roseivirga sp. 4D4 TaxID=1889784 RepID=UPI00147B11DD|nr:DUF4136 domain-containing protein [Roseivirga sp. 4D4]